MIERIGDIWQHHAGGGWVVITTNIGWKKNGSNPMGAGIAAHAADMYPELPGWYGARCSKYGADTACCLYKDARFILFPTKPLNEKKPWLSWQSDSTLDLIRRSAVQLQELGSIVRGGGYDGLIALPMVGCQNGGLNKLDVLPILRSILDDGFVLFERREF